MTSSEPIGRGHPGKDEGGRAPGFWIGPLLLAAAPFLLFALLLAFDRLLP